MIKTPYCLYRAEETTESIEGSIDIVSDELKIQIKKDLDKVRTQRRGDVFQSRRKLFWIKMRDFNYLHKTKK